jgi:hypothetical protein
VTVIATGPHQHGATEDDRAGSGRSELRNLLVPERNVVGDVVATVHAIVRLVPDLEDATPPCVELGHDLRVVTDVSGVMDREVGHAGHLTVIHGGEP